MTEEFKEKHSIDKYRVHLNYETSDLVPAVRSSPDNISYWVYSLKIKFANVNAIVCACRNRYRDSFKILEEEFDYQRCTSM